MCHSLLFSSLSQKPSTPLFLLVGTGGLHKHESTGSCLSSGRVFLVSVRRFAYTVLFTYLPFFRFDDSYVCPFFFYCVARLQMLILINRLPIQLYFVDAFHFAASATAAGCVSLQVMTLTFLLLSIQVLHSDVSFPTRVCIPAFWSTDVHDTQNRPGKFCMLFLLSFLPSAHLLDSHS